MNEVKNQTNTETTCKTRDQYERTRFFSYLQIIIFLMVATARGNSAPAHDHSAPGPILLKVEDRLDPIGVDDGSPEFSWQISASDLFPSQQSFQILVATRADLLTPESADCWNSGRVRSVDVAYHSYQGRTLESRRTYWWTVRIWSKTGEKSTFTEPKTFEMGLLTEKDWKAEWIWGGKGLQDDHRYFRKTFPLLTRPIKRARLYITGMHHYEIFLNSHPVGDGPNFSYPHRLYYQVFDITENVLAGEENVLGIVAHWYGSGQGRPLGQAGLLALLYVDYMDGGNFLLSSDESWLTYPAEWFYLRDNANNLITRRNNEGVLQENLDLRNHPSGWLNPGFATHDWTSVETYGFHPTTPWNGTPRIQETRIVGTKIRPKKRLKLEDGTVIADYGKVYAARPSFVLPASTSPDQETIVTTGYRLDNTRHIISHAQATDLKYTVRLSDHPTLFQPFGYLGFRYLSMPFIPGMEGKHALEIETRHHSVTEGLSSFSCSDDTLNRIWELAYHSVLFSAQEQFIDTPTREQAQFAYDGFLIGSAQMRLFGERDLNQQGLREFAESQERYAPPDGRIDAAYPNGESVQDIGDWTAIWPIWIAEYFEETGDKELVSDLYPNARLTGLWLKGKLSKESGLFWADPLTTTAGLIDWPRRYEYDMSTSYRTIMSLNTVATFYALSSLAQGANKIDESKEWRLAAQNLMARIQNTFWIEPRRSYSDGILSNGHRSHSTSQQTNALMASLLLQHRREYKKSIASYNSRVTGALEVIKNKGISTSPVLLRHLYYALGEAGDEKTLYKMLRDPQERGYAALLADDATFTYESWEGRRASSENSESHGFGAYPAIMTLQDYILGIRRVDRSYRRFKIHPLTLDLSYAEGCRPTQQGPICISWKSDSNKFNMKVTVPGNSTATVLVPIKSDGKVLLDGKPVKTKKLKKFFEIKNVGPGTHHVIH